MFSNHLQESTKPRNWAWEVCKTFMRRFDPDPRLQSSQRVNLQTHQELKFNCSEKL